MKSPAAAFECVNCDGMKSESATTRIYLVSALRRSLLWWILGPFLLLSLGLFVFGPDENRRAGLVLCLVFAPFLIWWHWYIGRVRLELSAQGVTHRQGRHVLHAEWRDVESVRLDRGREGFVTRVPMEGPAAERLAAFRGLWVSGVPFYDGSQQLLLGERRFIPIDPFACHLRSGRLLSDLDELAPELGRVTRAAFEEQARKARLTPPPPSPQQQMKRLRLFLLVSVLVGLGIWMAMAPDSAVARTAGKALHFAAAVGLLGWSLISVWSSRNAFRAGLKLLAILFAVMAIAQFAYGLALGMELITGGHESAAGRETVAPASR